MVSVSSHTGPHPGLRVCHAGLLRGDGQEVLDCWVGVGGTAKAAPA